MTLKAVIFDLDDTLYNERDFVKSGFKVVSEYLYTISGLRISKISIYRKLLDLHEEYGRGKVFDRILEILNLDRNLYLQTLIYLYRNHIPSRLRLNNTTKNLLTSLNEFKLGIITDGVYVTQRNKTDVLLKDFNLSCIIHTDSLGQQYWKPSQEPFQVACNLLKVIPSEAVYVGDNPIKDFKGARSIGMRTICWNPNELNHNYYDDFFKPDFQVKNCEELRETLIKMKKNEN